MGQPVTGEHSWEEPEGTLGEVAGLPGTEAPGLVLRWPRGGAPRGSREETSLQAWSRDGRGGDSCGFVDMMGGGWEEGEGEEGAWEEGAWLGD